MKPNANQSLERILESTVVVSSADLMPGAQTGLIHIEYGFAAGGTLDYLKVWSSITRGQWLLAWEYWMSALSLTAPASTSIMDTNRKAWRTFWNLRCSTQTHSRFP